MNLGSISSFLAQPQFVTYNATKAAIATMSDADFQRKTLFKDWTVKFEVKMKLATQNLISLVQNVKNNPEPFSVDPRVLETAIEAMLDGTGDNSQ